MAVMKKYEHATELTPGMRRMVRQLLESQAYREIMAANVFGHGIRYVPSRLLRQKLTHQIVEELEHFEEVESIYEQFGGSLLGVVEQRLAAEPHLVPYAESWLELAVTLFLYDRAGYFQIREYRDCSFVPYSKIIGKILEEEEGHENFGAEALKELCQDPKVRAQAQKLFNKWFSVAMLSFGRSGTAGNKLCLETGLKEHDSGEVMQFFIDDIKSVMIDCGLTFLPPSEMGLDLPEHLDFSLKATV